MTTDTTNDLAKIIKGNAAAAEKGTKSIHDTVFVVCSTDSDEHKAVGGETSHGPAVGSSVSNHDTIDSHTDGTSKASDYDTNCSGAASDETVVAVGDLAKAMAIASVDEVESFYNAKKHSQTFENLA